MMGVIRSNLDLQDLDMKFLTSVKNCVLLASILLFIFFVRHYRDNIHHVKYLNNVISEYLRAQRSLEIS